VRLAITPPSVGRSRDVLLLLSQTGSLGDHPYSHSTFIYLALPTRGHHTHQQPITEFNLRTHGIRVLLPGCSFELEPHPQVGRSRSPKKFGRSQSNHPLHPHYSWSEKDVEVASIAAINFSRAFYESYDKPADRLPVRRLAKTRIERLWLILT
jgi:hypothetical protein